VIEVISVMDENLLVFQEEVRDSFSNQGTLGVGGKLLTSE
jgi:hypothetical protein